MSYCSKCGSQVNDRASFCALCGESLAVTPVQFSEQDVKRKSEADTNNGMAVLAYVLFFIPLLTGDCKKSNFVKYHTNQGAILFIATAALGIGITVVSAILRSIMFSVLSWGIYGVFSILFNILWLLPGILLIVGIINAASNRTKPLPLIGDKFTIIK